MASFLIDSISLMPDIFDKNLNHYFLLSEKDKSHFLVELIRSNELKKLYKILYSSDLKEKFTLFDTLINVDQKGEFKQVITEALRTNSGEVFEKIAYDYAYPSQFFNDDEFNQMVLKSLFLDLDVLKIAGLKERKNPSLDQMVKDYEEERNLANRSIPQGIKDYWNLGVKNENV